MRGRGLACAALALVGAVASGAPPAAAQQERAAPDSPAGVEYALPLDRVREQAAPPAAGRDGGRAADGAAVASPPPLFGIGVRPAEAGDPRSEGEPRTEGDARSEGEPRGAAGAGSAVDGTGGAAETAAGGSEIGAPAGIALAVVGLGLALGLLMRRRQAWDGRIDAALAVTLAGGCGLAPVWDGLYGFSSWGAVALALIAALVALLVARRPPPTGLGLVALGGVALLWAWSALSTRWAASADQALLAADRWLLYAALVALLLLIVREDRAARLLVAAGALATGALAGYLCVRLVLPGGADLFLGGRLEDPLGYVNGQAGHLLLALWPALAVAEVARRPWVAGAALAAAVVLGGLIVLSQARAVALAGVIAAALLLAVVPGRRRRCWCLLTLGLGVALAAGPLLDVYGATSPGARRPDTDDLRVAIAALCAAAALAGALWGGLRWLVDRPAAPLARGRLRAFSGIALALAGLAIAASVATAVGDPVERARSGVREFKALDVDATREGGSRFASGGGNRYDYWRIAADQFAEHPLAGVGAGNYDIGYFAERRTDEDVRQPHSLPLQALAELGVVGLLGVLLLAGAALAGLIRRSRRARDDPGERLLAIAAGGTFAAWLAHTSADWLHLIPGVTGIALCSAVALVVAGRSGTADGGERAAARSAAARRGRATAGHGAVAVAIAALAGGAFLIAAPLLADRRTTTAQDLLAEDPRAALREAQLALRLDDEALPAYYAAAAAYARLGDYRDARATLLAATAREPHDFVSWGLLGDLAVRRGALGQARVAYARAARLNPRDRGLRRLARDPAAAAPAQARSTTAN